MHSRDPRCNEWGIYVLSLLWSKLNPLWKNMVKIEYLASRHVSAYCKHDVIQLQRSRGLALTKASWRWFNVKYCQPTTVSIAIPLAGNTRWEYTQLWVVEWVVEWMVEWVVEWLSGQESGWVGEWVGESEKRELETIVESHDNGYITCIPRAMRANLIFERTTSKSGRLREATLHNFRLRMTIYWRVSRALSFPLI